MKAWNCYFKLLTCQTSEHKRLLWNNLSKKKRPEAQNQFMEFGDFAVKSQMFCGDKF